jgi:hypothetical protein
LTSTHPTWTACRPTTSAAGMWTSKSTKHFLFFFFDFFFFTRRRRSRSLNLLLFGVNVFNSPTTTPLQSIDGSKQKSVRSHSTSSIHLTLGIENHFFFLFHSRTICEKFNFFAPCVALCGIRLLQISLTVNLHTHTHDTNTHTHTNTHPQKKGKLMEGNGCDFRPSFSFFFCLFVRFRFFFCNIFRGVDFIIIFSCQKEELQIFGDV